MSHLPYYSRAPCDWCWACCFAPKLVLEVVQSTSLIFQVELSGAVSSQYLTALLMAAPLATGEEGITIKIRDELVSQPYVDMTVRLMERFGIQVNVTLEVP